MLEVIDTIVFSLQLGLELVDAIAKDDNHLDAHGIDASVSGILDAVGKVITAALEEIVDALLVELGERTDNAVTRWRQAGVI